MNGYLEKKRSDNAQNVNQHIGTKKEKWLPIKDYEGIYSISNLGRVRRDKRYNTTSIGKILKCWENTHGYISAKLSSKKGKTFTVHKLVANAFLGECPSGLQINHISGIKTDNTTTNLEYVTGSYNCKHAHKLNLIKKKDRSQK